MTKAIADFFFNPILIIYYFFMGIDFKLEDKTNIPFFIINLVLSLFIVFCGCVYIELFVIYHFNLERDTHIEVSSRAKLVDDSVADKSVDKSELKSIDKSEYKSIDKSKHQELSSMK